jgi:hypothetical protein
MSQMMSDSRLLHDSSGGAGRSQSLQTASRAKELGLAEMPLEARVLTVSDSVHRGSRPDGSGPALALPSTARFNLMVRGPDGPLTLMVCPKGPGLWGHGGLRTHKTTLA